MTEVAELDGSAAVAATETICGASLHRVRRRRPLLTSRARRTTCSTPCSQARAARQKQSKTKAQVASRANHPAPSPQRLQRPSQRTFSAAVAHATGVRDESLAGFTCGGCHTSRATPSATRANLGRAAASTPTNAYHAAITPRLVSCQRPTVATSTAGWPCGHQRHTSPNWPTSPRRSGGAGLRQRGNLLRIDRGHLRPGAPAAPRARAPNPDAPPFCSPEHQLQHR